MHSCIYEGRVWHHRHVEAEHRFQRPLFLMYLDLDETETVFHRRWLWSTTRPAVARFCRSDHMGDPAESLQQSVRKLVQAEIGFRPSGPIRLLTQLRYFGYIINPVSFFFCFREDAARVEAIVAEVTNTPWGERHCYVIDARKDQECDQKTGRRIIRAEHAKTLHVSPFMPIDMNYHWQITEPAQQLSVHIRNTRQGRHAFDATLSLNRHPLTSSQLARVLVRYPLMTVQVVTSIYWQALRLWWKGVGFVPHPRRSDGTTPSGPPEATPPISLET